MAISNSRRGFGHELAEMFGAEMKGRRKAGRLFTSNREEEMSAARKLERLSPRLGRAAA